MRTAILKVMFDNLNLTNIALLIVCLLIAMTVHEAAHAFVGHKLGDDTAEREGRLSLNPLRHIDPLTTVLLPIVTLVLFHAPILAAKPVPFNPARVKYDEFGAAMIAAAGPITNLLLAVVGAVILRGLPSLQGIGLQFVEMFVVLNVALFVFNLVPIPPLDGSRVLYAFAPEPLQRLMEQLEPFGLYIIFALVLLGGFGGFLISANQSVLNLLLG